ncbi:GNAT family N-acetyltransferase [Lactococcus allomyrinae]|uniref:N-acetyltransferase n=1 Tax=Lactococcus allomyrinae TaxID=2419773 RepID=A0A387BFI4_9LACT|nr:GNAT family N-acetyltransferase [Lactococcus allomyrinae]AYF99875.1 hypothetical protein D7I46_01510 [Lactococcus allomyrinae]
MIKLTYKNIVDIGYTKNKDGSITLDYIHSKKQNLGYGGEALDWFLDKFSNYDIYLWIEPNFEETLSENQLIAFYKKHGFNHINDKYIYKNNIKVDYVKLKENKF